MKNIILYLLFPLLLIFHGCKNDEMKRHDLNEKFIKNFGNENFDEFAHYSITLRDWDWNRDPVFLAFDNRIDTGDCRLAYKVIVNTKTNTVKETSRIWTDSMATCPLDTAMFIKMALKANRYHLAGLLVDSNKNVFVKTIYGEGDYDLIRFSHPKYITEKYKKNWQLKEGAWYERIETK